MKIINLLINEDVASAERDLDKANSENIIEICRENLRILAAYRKQLLGLRDIPELNMEMGSALSRELIVQSRNAVRAAIESTVSTQNLTEELLNSFILINGIEAADTFNRLAYRGSDKWELQGGSVTAPGQDKISIADAVETAGQLRREAYAADKTTFFKNAGPAS